MKTRISRKQFLHIVSSIVLLMLTIGLFTNTYIHAQAQTPSNAIAHYAPDIDALLLQNGYHANIITIGDRRGLRASQRAYANSVWSRDLDYAISGYSYVLNANDMGVLRESTEQFLTRVDANGIVPETIYLRSNGSIEYENRQSWDSMPNLIHAVYTYVAKTGDHAFSQAHRETLYRIGQWIVALDNSGDGLPDNHDFPYGYYDSVTNSTMHTYAIAKYYTALHELAQLEQVVGQDGSIWHDHAERMRTVFHEPFANGGYWLENQAWPIAWRRADGSPVAVLETYGTFAALQCGLIAPEDGERYDNLIAHLHAYLPDLIAGPTPMRLALGGYPLDVRRGDASLVADWMLDSSAPWIVGLVVPAYAAAGLPDDARTTLDAYRAMIGRTDPPVLEFAAGSNACYGPGNSSDGGRTWDSAAWFMAVYGGHYGLTMTPSALIIEPHPLQTIPGDGIDNFSYQGAHLTIALDAANHTYSVQSDQPINVRLRPMATNTTVRVNDNPPQKEAVLTLEPGMPYIVVSENPATPSYPTIHIPANGLYNCGAMRTLWERTDLPIAEQATELHPRSWMWGPQPLTGGIREPYAQGPGGTRLVQYYDKSRMEINNPDAPQDRWYVTNGLLVVELMTGKMQIGDNDFEMRQPADLPVAGDPIAYNPNAPTYRSFGTVSHPRNPELAPDRTGTVVVETLAQDGSVAEDQALAHHNVMLGYYEEQLGHNIPHVFMDFFAQQGLVYENGHYGEGPIMDWVFAMGLPVSEPYWARVNVGGEPHDVLIQAFERRVLTYTPDSDPDWRVQMGNVGQHYMHWRYGR